MTKEDIKKFMPLMQAMLEGKTIQRHLDDMGWVYTDKIFVGDGVSLYRIKPEPKYRLFKSQEECWNEMHKHPDFGWVKYKDSKSMYHIHVVGHGYILIDGADLSFFEAFDKCEFTDGTPFGIKEE